MTTTALAALHRPDRYPRASAYDPAWLLDLDMGPNPLWLLEDLVGDLELRPGMRVLDLGSGKGATSVFLAREFGVEVVAADWWIPAEEAAAVFEEAGVGDRVTAVRAEAHALPFEEGASTPSSASTRSSTSGRRTAICRTWCVSCGPAGSSVSPRRP